MTPLERKDENQILFSHEDISKNPNGSHGWGNIEAHEAGEADDLPELLDFHDVVVRLEVVVLASEDEGDDRQLVDGAAVDDVLASNDRSSTEKLLPRPKN